MRHIAIYAIRIFQLVLCNLPMKFTQQIRYSVIDTSKGYFLPNCGQYGAGLCFIVDHVAGVDVHTCI